MAEPYSSTPVTGYPAAHQHQQQQPSGYPAYARYPPSNAAYYYPNPNHSQTPLYSPNPRTTLLRRIIAAIIVAIVLFFIIFFICWLVIRPHRPQFHVTSFSVSNFNISSQKVSGNWNAHFQVYNPNKKLKISYDQIVCSLLYKSQILSQTRLPPFYQDTKNLTSLVAFFSALDSYVDDWVVNDITRDRSRASVPFNLRLTADVGFKVGGFRARRRLLRVRCDDVPLGLSATSNGFGNLTTNAAPTECKVYA